MRKQTVKKSPETVSAKGDDAKKEKKIKITAARDTFLPDGSFVAKGKVIEVSADFVARLKSEKDRAFII